MCAHYAFDSHYEFNHVRSVHFLLLMGELFFFPFALLLCFSLSSVILLCQTLNFTQSFKVNQFGVVDH